MTCDLLLRTDRSFSKHFFLSRAIPCRFRSEIRYTARYLINNLSYDSSSKVSSSRRSRGCVGHRGTRSSFVIH